MERKKIRLAVCVKQVPGSDDVKIHPKTGVLCRSDTEGVMNPADCQAVRIAVELAEGLRKGGKDAEITAVTMGPPGAALVLREAVMRGADRGLLLCDSAFAGADTFATSLTLAAAVRREGGFSVILAGNRSSDGETGHIGPQLAEQLKLPFLSGVRAARLDHNILTAERIFDGACETVRAALPVVLSAEGTEREYKSFSIGEIERACEKSLVVLGREELGLSEEETGLKGSKTKVRRTFLQAQGEKGKVIQGNTDEMAELFAEELLKRLAQGEGR